MEIEEISTPQQCFNTAQALLETSDKLTTAGQLAAATEALAWVNLGVARRHELERASVSLRMGPG